MHVSAPWLAIATVVLATSLMRAAEPTLPFVAVPAEQSGLTHIVNSEPDRGKLDYPWMSPPVDVDGDGRLDLIVYGHHGGGAAIWLNQGERKFALDAEPYAARWPFGARDPIWWQFTAVGPPWGLGTEGTGKSGRLYFSNTHGFWESSNLHFSGADYGSLQWSDLDGDGRHRELFAGGKALRVTPSPEKWEAELNGNLTTETLWEIESLVPWPAGIERGRGPGRAGYRDLYAVDLDGDDRNELIVHFRGEGFYSETLFTWVLHRDDAATGAAAWRDATTERGLPGDVGHWLFPEDVDADGDLDLVDLHAGTLFTNDGRGRFAAAAMPVFDPRTRGRNQSKSHPWTADNELQWLDLDNNGFRDLVTASDHGTARGAFLNFGDGGFVEIVGVPGSRRNRKFDDVDGDGRLEMITFDGKQLTLHRNESTAGGLLVRLQPRDIADAQLGAKLWVYRGGQLGTPAALLHYRQAFMERDAGRSTVLIPRLHVGVGDHQSVDVRVRFPSGIVREVHGAEVGDELMIQE